MSDRSTRYGVLTEVADGVFSYFQPEGGWAVNTNGIVVLDDAVLVIDSCATEARTLALSDAVAAVAGGRRRILINTHHHIDHTNGNGLLGADLIVGHPACRARLLLPPPPPPGADVFPPAEWGRRDPVPPGLTVSGESTWHSGDREIRLIAVPRRAHTDNDLLVWLPQDGVLFGGDVVMNASMPLAMEGSVAGMLETLAEIARLAPRRIVPGHGADVGPEFLDVVTGYFEFVRDAATAGSAAGHAPLEIARNLDLGEFASMLDGERIVGNLYRALAELDGQGDAPLPMPQVMADMVAYHGGPLSRTV